MEWGNSCEFIVCWFWKRTDETAEKKSEMQWSRAYKLLPGVRTIDYIDIPFDYLHIV